MAQLARAAVSKTAGWGFESLLTCNKILTDAENDRTRYPTMKEKITNFVSDVIKEMKKVTWPTREELKDSTVVVLVSSVLISLFIFAVDWVLQQMMTLLLAG